MSSINNSLGNTIGFLLSSQSAGISPNAVVQAAPPLGGLDPNDQRVLNTLRDSSSLPLARAGTATGLTPQAAAETINRLQARNMLEIVTYDDLDGRFIRLTPQGYSALAGLPVA